MASLRELNELATEALAILGGDTSSRRVRRNIDLMVDKIYQCLRPTVRRMAIKKNMLESYDDIQQHAYIAIHRALGGWDGEISSFSTYVHWQIRAEIRTLELHLFPERRKVSANIDVSMLQLNRRVSGGEDSDANVEIGDFLNLDPASEERTESLADRTVFLSNVERALARMVHQRVAAYEHGGCVNRSPVVGIMRDIHIFIQRNVEEKAANRVAFIHNITRERIRQITDNMKKQFEFHVADMQATQRPADPEVTRRWLLAAAIYRESSGADIRLIQTLRLPSADQMEIPEGMLEAAA